MKRRQGHSAGSARPLRPTFVRLEKSIHKVEGCVNIEKSLIWPSCPEPDLQEVGSTRSSWAVRMSLVQETVSVFEHSRVWDGCLVLDAGLFGACQDDSRAGNPVKARMNVAGEITSVYAGLRETGGRLKRRSPVAEFPNCWSQQRANRGIADEGDWEVPGH